MNKTRIFFTTLLVTVLCIVLSCSKSSEPAPQDPSVTRKYLESSAVIFNPERGFLHGNQVFSEGTPLSVSYLKSLINDNVSLSWRIYYLEKFKNSDLSQTQLNLIETDMANLRTAGLKCVLRFAYTDSGDDGEDAPIEIVERHIDQLKPIFQANADVIAFVNGGFVGLWGEWHSSTNNLTSLDNRQRIVAKLLDALPPEIKIQLRTPKHKREVFGETEAMTDEVGYSNADIARTGHHNDCFMASPNDYGTYQNPTIDKAYISQEANYVPTGGETCPPSGIEAADCETALSTMAHLKWTYLNLDWYQPVLNGWRSEGCFEEFEMTMGYRYVLKATTVDTVMSNTQLMPIRIELMNVGWAPIYNYKNTSLVLVSESGGKEIEAALDIDLRKARPNEDFIIQQVIDLSDITPGIYSLHLKIADQFESIKDRPEYCIQMANHEVWDNSTGLNNLKININITE